MPNTPNPSRAALRATAELAFARAYPEIARLSSAEIRLLMADAAAKGRHLIKCSDAMRAEIASLVKLPFPEDENVRQAHS